MKDLYKHLKQHPAHAIIGAMLVLTGLNLIFTHHYYFWPPYVANTLNGDLPGTWALLSGLGLIYVAVQKKMPINVNKVWLISASGFLGFEPIPCRDEDVNICAIRWPGGDSVELIGWLDVSYDMVNSTSEWHESHTDQCIIGHESI